MKHHRLLNNFEYAYHTLGLPVGDAMEWAKKRTPGYGGPSLQQSSSYRFDFFVNGFDVLALASFCECIVDVLAALERHL